MRLRNPIDLDLSLRSEDFRTLDFWIYRGLRFLLLPLGKFRQASVAAHLHWIFRHLSIATSSHYFGVEFLNARSAIVQGGLIQRHIKSSDFVVDVACGSARYIPILDNLGVKKYLGIDSSSIHINRNTEIFPEWQFKLSDVMDEEVIPSCDIIIASHFLEHLESPELFLSQIRNSCKKILIEVPDFFADPINLVSLSVGAPWWTDPDHEREYSESAMEELLNRCGFKVIDKAISGATLGVVAIPIQEIQIKRARRDSNPKPSDP